MKTVYGRDVRSAWMHGQAFFKIDGRKELQHGDANKFHELSVTKHLPNANIKFDENISLESKLAVKYNTKVGKFAEVDMKISEE